MQKFLLFLISVFLLPAVLAAGEGTYGNETYGNFSYGISSSSSSSFSNSSVTTTANTTTVINATQGASAPNAALEIVTNSDTAGAVTLVKYDSQPSTVSTNTFASPLNKYLDVVVDNSISSQLNYSIIKMFYTDAEVTAADLQESTMRLSKWNGSEWIKFDPPTGGVDTTNNFVWANTSSFSTWGVFGTAVPAPSPAPSGGAAPTGGGGGGGGGNWGWECSAWSECSPSGTQSRTCNLVPGGSLSAKPAETQTCSYTAPTPTAEEASTPTVPVTTATPAQTPTITPPVPTPPAPTGFAVLTGAFISDLKNPSTWIGIIVAVLVAAALYAGYYYLYKKK